MLDIFSLSPSSESEGFGKQLPMQIAEYIAGEIFSGRFKPGDRLKEEGLADKFRTSRAPVREALYLLHIDGLVDRLPRRGTVVREYTEKEVQELYEVRLGLEQLAIDRLANRWTDDGYQQFMLLLQDMSTAVSEADIEQYGKCNALFHQLLFKLADSEILWRLYRQLTNPLIALIQISTQQKPQMQQSYGEHEQIVQALQARQFSRAKELLAENVRHGLNRAIQTRHNTTSLET